MSAPHVSQLLPRGDTAFSNLCKTFLLLPPPWCGRKESSSTFLSSFIPTKQLLVPFQQRSPFRDSLQEKSWHPGEMACFFDAGGASGRNDISSVPPAQKGPQLGFLACAHLTHGSLSSQQGKCQCVRELVFSNSKAFQPKMAGGWEKERARDAPFEKKNMDKIVWELGAQKQQVREFHHQEKAAQSQWASLPSSHQHSFGAATNTDQWPPAQPLREKLQACKRTKHQVSSVKEPMDSAVQCRCFQQIIFSASCPPLNPRFQA